MKHLRLPLILSLVLWAPLARAQEPSVKELFENGQIHYDSGQYDLALEAWGDAWRQSQRALLLIKMADAHEALGELEEAIDLLQKYRVHAEESELASLTARVEMLRVRQAEAMVSEPEPTETPAPSPDPEPAEPAPTPVEREPTRRRPLALDLTLGGVTAGGVALGTGAGLSALSARNSAMESCVESPRGAVCTAGADPSLARDGQMSALSDVGFAIGGVAGIVWAGTALIGPKAGDLAVVPTHGGAHLLWTAPLSSRR